MLDVPRDRAGLFRASLFAKYERSEQALVLAMVEMYFHGVSTRKVNAIVEKLSQLGWGTKRDGSKLEAPGEVRDIGIVAEGAHAPAPPSDLDGPLTQLYFGRAD